MAKTKKWLRKVKTVSTAPPKDLFTKDAQTIAETMAKKSVSPKGIGSGVRMIQYFISRRQKSVGGAQAEARNSQEVAAKEKQPKTRSELELRQNQSSLRQPGAFTL